MSEGKPIDVLVKLISNYTKRLSPDSLTERHQLIGKLETMLKELEFRREWMKPWDELYEEDESWNDIDEKHMMVMLEKNLNSKIYDLECQIINITHTIERIEDKLTKPSEPTCEHVWVLKSSTTWANTYQCSKCWQWKTDTWGYTAGTGGWTSG